jgi:uncharacterized protein
LLEKIIIVSKTNYHTLVLGASERTDRYANKAIAMLRHAGYPVTAVGIKEGEAHGTLIKTEIPKGMGPVHSVTLYLSPQNQQPWLEKILALKPQRVIFNPGTENPDFEQQLSAAGIEPLQACTLVMLSTNQYE